MPVHPPYKYLQTEKMAALRWGTTQYEETERELPAYKVGSAWSYIGRRIMGVYIAI